MDRATVDHLLTTTRSVRKRLDFSRPVEPTIIERCIEIAIQAPTGGNTQGWHFMVITDAQKRLQIGELYKKSWQLYIGERSQPMEGQTRNPNQMRRVGDSARYLPDHIHEAPVLIIPCVEGRYETQPAWLQASLYGSILPATWSLMLALRSRGLGSAWTTLHIRYEQEVATILDIPANVTQAALLPAAYYLGEDFKPADRMPAREFTYWDTWGIANRGQNDADNNSRT